jgi:endonuclease/exonuclease/phosphatase family metal-dependent hydrolase
VLLTGATIPNERVTYGLARNPATPYRCDGIFVPAAWYRCLEDCQVISDPSWHSLSDHNPVVTTLENS